MVFQQSLIEMVIECGSIFILACLKEKHIKAARYCDAYVGTGALLASKERKDAKGCRLSLHCLLPLQAPLNCMGSCRREASERRAMKGTTSDAMQPSVFQALGMGLMMFSTTEEHR